MAIKFDDAYKNKINRIVQNYNRRVRRARTEGSIPTRKLPELASSYALKKNYTSRAELDKELKNLEQFRRKAVRRKYNTTLNEYENFLVHNNQQEALKFFEHRYERQKQNMNPDSLHDKNLLGLYSDYIKFLKKDIDTVSDTEARTMYKGVNIYRNSKARQGGGYRGFLSEVEWVMDKLDYDEKVKNEFFNKLKKLTPDEFYDVYVDNAIIKKVYRLAESDSAHRMKLMDTEESAEDIIKELVDNVDLMIKEVKENKRI